MAVLKYFSGFPALFFILSALALPPVTHAASVQIAAGDVTALILAIREANQNDTEVHTIHLAPGHYTLTDVDNMTQGPNGLPSLSGHLTIQGAGAGATTIQRDAAAPAFRLLHIERPGILHLNDLTLTGGALENALYSGGAIRNSGSVQLTASEVYHNTASYGGALATTGSLVLQHSTVYGNTALVDGGGVFNQDGSVESHRSTIRNNVARAGGGIHSTAGHVVLHDSTVRNNQADQGGGLSGNAHALMELYRSTVHTNTATSHGGGIVNGAVLTLHGSTLRDNSATNGGGLDNELDTVATLRDSLIYGNTARDGGGMRNAGHVILYDSTVRANAATAAGGGLLNQQGTVELQTCMLVDNMADDGGGLHSQGGWVLVNECTVGHNHATTGGGLSGHSESAIDIIKSEIQDNTAAAEAGGILNRATLMLRQSTLQGNTAATHGGGGVNHAEGRLTLLNSTISGNDARRGGGLDNAGSVSLMQSTVAGNTADAGGGISSVAGRVELRQSVMAGNTAESQPEADCAHRGGTLISLGHNLVGAGAGCPHQDATDQTVAPADVFVHVLGPLQRNGGPTATHALLPDSPALDAGSAACPPPFTDQRDVNRPQGSACDIGAFEVGLPEAVRAPALLQPMATATDSNGQLVVLDTRLQSIVRTDFASGYLDLVSGASVGNGTRLSRFLGGIAVEPTGTLIVTDSGRSAIVRVDAVAGDRSIVSNGVTGTGPPFETPGAIAVAADGALIVIADTSIIRMHPHTGDRKLVSGCTDHDGETCLGAQRGSGPPFVMLQDIDVETTGQLVVADSEQQAVIRIDPATGNRSIVSGNAIGGGPPLDTPSAIAVEASGAMVVADFESILRVNAATGDRTRVSDGNHGDGPPLRAPAALTATVSGDLAVADGNRLLRIDPVSGHRTVFVAAQLTGDGPPIPRRALAVEPQGTIVVAGAVEGRRAIIRVMPETGARSLISDTTRGNGPAFVGPADIAIESDGSLVLVDVNRRDSGTVMQVDAATGDRTIISGCTQGSSQSCQGIVVGDGPPFQFPQSIAVEASGQLVVADRDRAAVLRVDPETGNRIILSDNASGNGPVLQSPRAIAVAPDDTLMVVDAIVSRVPNVSVPDAVVRVHPLTGDRVLISGLQAGDGLLSVFDLLDAITMEPSGSVIVASSFFRVLLRVDPETGDRTVVSGEHIGHGPPFFPGSVAVNAAHTLVVLDTQLGVVLHVDAASGARTIVSR